MADEMTTIEFTEEEKAIQRAVAKVLYQIDKKLGDEAGQTVSDWTEVKADYLKRGSRLMRTFKRQGLDIVATKSFVG